MKKIFLALLILSTFTASAQNRQKLFMPKEGYWVVENNVKTPRQSIVYFYTSDDILVYKENVSGKKINIRRKKIVMKLNHALLQSITAWRRDKEVKENTMLVKNSL